MAFIGFIALSILGVALVISGIGLLCAALGFGSVRLSDHLLPFILVLAGCAALYFAYVGAPFTITLTGAANG